MKKTIIVKDGVGRRIVTEIKRPDPAAVLVIDEETPFEVSDDEIQLLIDLNYVKLKDICLVGKDGEILPVKEIQTGNKYDKDEKQERPGWAKSSKQLAAEAAAKEKVKADAETAKAKDEAEAAAKQKEKDALDKATAEAKLKNEAEAAAKKG